MKAVLTLTAGAMALGLATANAQTSSKPAPAKPTVSSQQGQGDCPRRFEALNKDQQISQREERQIRLSVFEALDEDTDSFVSREEYVKCLASTPAFLIAGVAGLGGRPDATGLLNRTESRFQAIDNSNDGKISWDEYMDAAEADFKRFGKARGSDDADGSAVAGWAFARLDEDLSGDITMKEWTADAGFAQIRDRSFEAFDRDKDTKLSREEFETGAGPAKTGTTPSKK